jgi:hypothetical protein
LITTGRPGAAPDMECSQNADVPHPSFAQVTVGIRITWIT